METSTIDSTITLADYALKTVPVVVGAFIALLGGFFATWFPQHFNKKKEAAQLKIKKIEELLLNVYEAESWLDDYKNNMLSSEQKDIGSSPLSKVKYLSALYIPELQQEVSVLGLAHANFTELVASSNVEKLKIGAVPDKFLEQYQSKYVAVISAIDSLTDKSAVVVKGIEP